MKAAIRRHGLFFERSYCLTCALAIAVFVLGAMTGMIRAQTLPGGGSFTNTPLASWSFQDNTNWTSDTGHAPVSFTNLNFSKLGDGDSLVVATNIPAWLRFAVVEPVDGTTNLTVDTGSITIWFAPGTWSSTNSGGAGPGEWSQLINVGEWTPDASYGYFGLSVDAPGTNLWFGTQNGWGNTYGLSVPVSWATNYFHFIVLTYSSTNVSLYLDGVLATNDPGGLSVYPGSEVLSNGFYFGSDTNGLRQAKGLFNLVSTYNYPLNSNDVREIFNYDYGYYLISPWNTAMWQISSATSSPAYTPTYNAVSGPGDLQVVGAAPNCYDGSNVDDVWITNVTAVATGSGAMNVIFTIEGGASEEPYDVFANSMLSFGTNGAPWAWMGQGYQCTTYMLTNLPNTTCFLILGTPQDTSGFGLTDAYELLVAKINPEGGQTDSHGVPYAWYAQNGLSAQSATQDSDQDGLLNYQEYFYGTNPKVSEGFGIWVGAPTGITSIP